jgi:prepilin-type N-terminal cleavage/methylation domain-containing protein
MNIRRRGFTLIELLVVVLIIGVLASIAMPQYFKVVERARAAEALSTFAGVKAAQERSMAKTGDYTTSWDTLDLTLKTSGTGVECTGTSPCVSKIYTYTLTATAIEAKRNAVPTPPARYGNYTMSYNPKTDAITCDKAECQAELLGN